jgi:hypothetical protein
MEPVVDLVKLAAGLVEPADGAVLRVGSIDLPTGRLVIDGGLDNLAALEVDFGGRPLHVWSIVAEDADGDPFVAAAVLSVHESLQPTRWEPAKRVGEDEAASVGIDFAYITAHDQSMEEDLDETRQAAIDEHDYLDDLMAVRPPGEVREMRRTASDLPHHARRFAVIPAGPGDGVYNIFLGRDENGRAEQVVVDFLFGDQED